MQPYLFPYVGYFQLIGAVDQFIVYDNVKYTKKGWINRNRFLQEGADELFSVPLRKDSDFLEIRRRVIAPDFAREKLLNRLREAYRRAPCFQTVFPLVEGVFRSEEENLFLFVHRSILDVCRYLGIGTNITISSVVEIDHSLRGKVKVIALCRAVGARTYVNPIGGTGLYATDEFAAEGIELRFLRSRPLEYPQFGARFVPWLSIIDVMMFNPRERVRELVAGGYELVEA